MGTDLNQIKLNGSSKKGMSIFNWRGQFNLEFVEYILGNFTINTSVVCDPFSGSGTVLYECAKRNITCIGMDVNPAAYYMSKFFSYANKSKNDREKLIRNVNNSIEYILSQEIVTFEGFVKSINEISNEREMCFVANLVFIASKSKKNYNNNDVKQEIRKAFKYLEAQMIGLPICNNSIDVYLQDARKSFKVEFKNKFDLIFTSPPYINVFNYHQNYRNAVELLGWDILDIAQSEIGSNRKNRGNRFKTVVQYCIDMLLTLEGFWNTLKEEGVAILVLGKTSSVRGVEFHNDSIVKDIIYEMKGFNFEECYDRKFVNKFGKEIHENIIICRKKENILSDTDIAKNVAIKHLKKSLENAEITDDIYNSIEKTIREIQFIEPSPILEIKGM